MSTCSIHAGLLALAILVTGCARYDTPVVEADGPLVRRDAGLTSEPRDSDPSRPTLGGYCALDSVAGVPVAQARPRAGEIVLFGGWVSDADGQTPETAELVLKNDEVSFQFEIHPQLHRPDVADALQYPGLEYSGFDAQVNLSGVPAGRYRASVIIPADPLIECSFDRDVLIESAS